MAKFNGETEFTGHVAYSNKYDFMALSDAIAKHLESLDCWLAGDGQAGVDERCLS